MVTLAMLMENAAHSTIKLLLLLVGKVGGIELGYGSDLDLVFIHYLDEQSDTVGTSGISTCPLYCR